MVRLAALAPTSPPETGASCQSQPSPVVRPAGAEQRFVGQQPAEDVGPAPGERCLVQVGVLGADVRGEEVIELLTHRAFLIPLLGSSLLATVVAISLMNLFQRELDPVRAAILYAIEPVWAALISIGAGSDSFNRWLWIGGGALLAGNVIAELGPLLARRRAARAARGT